MDQGRGRTFAEQQMQRHGWTEGKGLGKREDGISEAIKVKVKCDTAGVGHNSAEQFTFHWWDHVFNKTASSISVEPHQDGVKVKKLSQDDSAVSSKKPRKAMLNSNMLYGRFIKSATLTSGGEKPVEESPSSSSDSSEDEDTKLDLSSATKLSDEDLMRICGGRTAHKGARHGLTMSAKLSRIEEQERAFMEKYGKNGTKSQPSKSSSEVGLTEEFNKRHKKRRPREGQVNGEEEDNPPDSEVPKKKKKKHKRDAEEMVDDVPDGLDQEHVPSIEEERTSSRKSNGPHPVEMTEVVEENGDHDLALEEENRPAKKKKKRKTVEEEESMMVNGQTEDCVHSPGEGDSGHDKENTEEEAGKSRRRKNKKSKKAKDPEEHTMCSKEGQPRNPQNKKGKVDEENAEGGRSRREKKQVADDDGEPKDDDKATKKKKKSKHKDRRD